MTEIVKTQFGKSGVLVQTRDDLQWFAGMCAKTMPRYKDKPEYAALAIMAGMELGLTPQRAADGFFVVNGKAGPSGDCALACIRSSGKCKWIKYGYEGTEGTENWSAWVKSQRVDEPEPVTHVFSVKDAKLAGLWGKAGPWVNYPKRMLYYRALGFHVRDVYGDVLHGMAIAEELDDYPVVKHVDYNTPPAQKDGLLDDLTSGNAVGDGQTTPVPQIASNASPRLTAALDKFAAVCVTQETLENRLGKLAHEWGDPEFKKLMPMFKADKAEYEANLAPLGDATNA